MRTANSGLERVARELATDAIEIYRLRFQAEQLVATSRGYLLTGKPETLQRFDAEAEGVNEMLGRLSHRAARVERAAQEYIRDARQAAQQRTATDDPQAIVPFFERTLAPARARFEDAIAEMVRRGQDDFESASRRARRFADRVETFAVAATGVAVLLGLALTGCVPVCRGRGPRRPGRGGGGRGGIDEVRGDGHRTWHLAGRGSSPVRAPLAGRWATPRGARARALYLQADRGGSWRAHRRRDRAGARLDVLVRGAVEAD